MAVNYTQFVANTFVCCGEWSLFLSGYDIRGNGSIIVPCYEIYRGRLNRYLVNDSVPKHIARRLLRKAIKKSKAVFQEAVEYIYV